MASNPHSLTIDSITLGTSLSELRDNIDLWSDREDAKMELCAIARQHDLDWRPFVHPRIVTALFDAEYCASTVRAEIERALETFGIDTTREEVTMVVKHAALAGLDIDS